MNEAATTQLEVARQGLRELGYEGDLLQDDYAFADFSGSDPRLRHIPLAAFGHLPTSFESAWIGVTVGPQDAHSLRQFQALGAPQILVLEPDWVARWRMPASGDAVLQDRLPAHSLLQTIRDRQTTWGREAVSRAKAISFLAAPLQLDFYDAGLVPTIEATVSKKLDKLLRVALARGIATYKEHLLGEVDEPGLYRLVFRMLAAKLLADRGHPGDWTEGSPGQVVERVEDYYYHSQPLPPAVTHPEVQGVVWRYIQSGFYLQNVSVDTLAYIYENTLVTRELRKRQSIHGTPPQLARYVVHRLPFEGLARNDRRVFEPFAGQAVFLIAALGRLRELLEPELGDKARHDYFVHMLAGMEEEPFALEAARLSLMLADYPNPDGWRLEQRDIFAADDLEGRIGEARVVLCNPPFERFSPGDHPGYSSLRSVSRAADILTRVLERPPAMLGFVLPRVFRDGHSFRHLHRRLAELYGVIEMTELPDGMFAYSDVETLLLLAHGPNRGMVEVRRAAVHRQDLQRFFTTGQPTWSSTEVVPSAEAAHAGSLWRPPLQPVWQALGSYPQLGAVAEVHRGLEYVIPLRERRKELESDQPREGFLRGLMNVQKDYEPFRTAAATYLNTSTELIRRGADLATKWEKPKVIVNRHRKSRAAWPLVAALDRQGLILYHNFYGIWPTGEWTIEALAAVLNGFVSNAFVGVREEKRDNRVNTVKAVPVPNLTRDDLASVTELVQEYERQREALDRAPSDELAGRCSRLLGEIDATVLRAYALPASVESELLQHFAGTRRPGPHQPPPEGHPGIWNTPESTAAPLASTALRDDRLEVTDTGGVSRLLQQEPGLPALLREAADQIVRHIPDAHMRLRLLPDPDYGEAEQLFLGVSTRLQDEEALSALQRFDREWWVHEVPRAHGLLCVDLEDA